MRLIDADALEQMGYVLTRTYKKDKETMVYETKKLSDVPSAQPRMTCDGCKYANHPTGWSDVCVLCIRNFRNFTDRYER